MLILEQYIASGDLCILQLARMLDEAYHVTPQLQSPTISDTLTLRPRQRLNDEIISCCLHLRLPPDATLVSSLASNDKLRLSRSLGKSL